MEKDRYEYARSLYEREFDIKERLEKKAAAVFALPSSFIGVLFLKSESATQLTAFFRGAEGRWLQPAASAIFVGFFLLMGTSITMAVVSLALQSYRKEYPPKLYAFLLEPGKRYLENSADFFDELAGRFALATEHNARANQAKAQRLRVAVLALFGSVIALLIFLALYLQQNLNP